MKNVNLKEEYRRWRVVLEESLSSGENGSTDCGESGVLEDFCEWCGVDVDFYTMLDLEKEYEFNNKK